LLKPNFIAPEELSYNFVTIDINGHIWLGTQNNGLLEYDGSTWSQFDKTNSGLISNNISSILIDNGSLWIGSVTGGLVKKFNTDWQKYILGIQAYLR